MAKAVTVRVGQVWKDNDPRVGDRWIKVESIDGAIGAVERLVRGPFANCLSSYDSSNGPWRGRRVHIAIERFNPKRQTGYTLVRTRA